MADEAIDVGRAPGRCAPGWRRPPGRHAPRRRAGWQRSKMTPSPLGSTFQPMMSSVSGQVCSPRALDARQAALAARARTQAAAPSPNRAVADHVGLGGQLVHAEGRGAELDDHQQHRRARPGARQPAGDGEARTRRRRSRGRTPARARRRRGSPCGPPTRASRLGVAMPVEDTVTMVSTSRRLAAGVGERARSPPRRRGRLRALEIGRVALRPALRLQIPLDRARGPAFLDAGVQENAPEPFEIAHARREDAGGMLRHNGLRQDVRGRGGGE